MNRCKECFGYTQSDSHNDRATGFRSWVLHVKYVVIIALSALVWASLVATLKDSAGNDVSRKDECALYGSLDATGCARIDDATDLGKEQLDQNGLLHQFAISGAIINALLLVHSVFTHESALQARIHYNWVFKALVLVINVILFSLMVGYFRQDDKDSNGAELLAEANLENNVYFKDTFNPYTAAAAGLVFVLVEFLTSAVFICRYGKRCRASGSTDNGPFGSGGF